MKNDKYKNLNDDGLLTFGFFNLYNFFLLLVFLSSDRSFFFSRLEKEVHFNFFINHQYSLLKQPFLKFLLNPICYGLITKEFAI
jgi:hypothetical protein